MDTNYTTYLPVVDERWLLECQPGARELFHLSDEHRANYYPIVKRANGTYRLDDMPNGICGLFKPQRPHPPWKSAVFIQLFDGVNQTLKYVGTEHWEDTISNANTRITDKLPPWRRLAGLPDGEAICVYEDLSYGEVERVDVRKTFSQMGIGNGDILVIQRESDPVKYTKAHQQLPILPPPSFMPKTPLHNHARKLWEHRQNTDILLRYGPTGSATLKCHSQILSMSSYFDTLFNNTTFQSVSEARLDPTHNSKAVDLIIEYMYLNDPTKLINTNLCTKLAMIKFADFINMVDIVLLLTDSIRLRAIQAATICDVLKLGLENAAAGKLTELAVDWIFEHMEELHKGGPLKEFLRDNEDAYSVVIEGMRGRVNVLKRKHAEM